MTKQKLVIGNVPHLQDVTTTISLLSEMGAESTINDKMEVEICTKSVNKFIAPYEMVKTMRASILVLGPLLANMVKLRFHYLEDVRLDQDRKSSY